MNANQFLPFGLAGGAYVYNYATWLAKPDRLTGYGPGLLPKEDLNTAIRQACFVASALSQWVADHGPAGSDVLDDGIIANWEAQFQAALLSGGIGGTFKVYAGNPNGNLAGVQGDAASAPTVFPSVCWDTTNTIWWVCSVTGNAAAAVWLPIGDDVGWPNYCTQTGGTANAPVLAPPATLRAVTAGTAIAWAATTGPNTAAVVVTVTGFGNYPLYKSGPTGPEPLTGGELQVGNLITARLDGAGHFQLVATELGTAALANASSKTGTVAAVFGAGALTVDALAQYRDVSGTLKNGPSPTSATGKVAAVAGATTVGHLAVFSDVTGTVTDGGLPGVAAAPTYLDDTHNGQTLASGVYLVDSSAAAFGILLPLAPVKGDSLQFIDAGGSWGANNFTVGRNGQTIETVASDLVCNVPGEVFRIWFNGATWRME